MNDKLEKVFKACGFQSVDEQLACDLNKIITWQKELHRIDVKGVKPMFSTIGDDVGYISRSDTNSSIRECVLNNAPDKNDNFFLVPKVIKN